jgi:hypothetical protein
VAIGGDLKSSVVITGDGTTESSKSRPEREDRRRGRAGTPRGI